MKLNFKEWNIIIQCIREKAEQIESNLRYYDDEDSDMHKRCVRELADVNGLIAKIENFTV